MPNHATREHLEALRAELRTTGAGLPTHEREHLEALLDRLEADEADEDPGVSDSLHLAAERFEVKHPSLAATLRNIGVNLANIGI
ncbi:DUF4404 family protein [Streptomyces sp. NPDC002039]|uniref:DUF4404 family protein n=1 Tax=unclassified Streptomyces TaxID=2593676 RepID=UPI0033249CF4